MAPSEQSTNGSCSFRVSDFVMNVDSKETTKSVQQTVIHHSHGKLLNTDLFIINSFIHNTLNVVNLVTFHWNLVIILSFKFMFWFHRLYGVLKLNECPRLVKYLFVLIFKFDWLILQQFIIVSNYNMWFCNVHHSLKCYAVYDPLAIFVMWLIRFGWSTLQPFSHCLKQQDNVILFLIL